MSYPGQREPTADELHHVVRGPAGRFADVEETIRVRHGALQSLIGPDLTQELENSRATCQRRIRPKLQGRRTPQPEAWPELTTQVTRGMPERHERVGHLFIGTKHAYVNASGAEIRRGLDSGDRDQGGESRVSHLAAE
jgi:hypothetical protein